MPKIIQVSTSVANSGEGYTVRTVAVGDNGRAYLLEGERVGHPHWYELPELPGQPTELCGKPGPKGAPCLLVRTHGGKCSWERRPA